MLDQAGQAVIGYAQFTTGSPPTGKTGLTVTTDVYRITRSNLAISQVVTGGSATEIGGGGYGYRHVTTSGAAYDYLFIFKTSDSTVTQQHIPALWITGPTWVENINSTVSSRSSHSASDVWNVDTSQPPFSNPDTIGEYVFTYLATILADGLTAFSSLTSILNRIGAFAGSGDNTILGFFKAIARSDAPTPSNLGGTFDPATHSLQAHLTSLFTRDLSTITGEAARSFLNALRVLRNKTAISGSTLTVYEEDDATTAWTATLSSDSGAAPVTGVDPS